MFEEFLEYVESESKNDYPNESVFIITRDHGCEKVDNVSKTPDKDFQVKSGDMVRAYSGGLLAIIHSHPDGPDYPSEADMRGQERTGVPWGILCTDGTHTLPITWWGDDVEMPPLEGRTFRHGITDCYSLIRDFYRDRLGITLPVGARNWEWWLNGQDLYKDNFAGAGFRVVDYDNGESPKPGDVWLSQIRSPVPNHGGVYLGDEMILHHPTSKNPVDPTRPSKKEPIHRWMPHIVMWLRHQEMEDG